MGQTNLFATQRQTPVSMTFTMAKCVLLLLGLTMMLSPFLGVEASPAPVAKPDPRDYVLVPMSTYRSAANYEQGESAQFRSAEPKPVHPLVALGGASFIYDRL